MLIGGGGGINWRLSTDSGLRPRRTKKFGKKCHDPQRERQIGWKPSDSGPSVCVLRGFLLSKTALWAFVVLWGLWGQFNIGGCYLFEIKLCFEYASRTAELVGGKGVDCLWNWETARMRAFPCSPCSQCLIQHLQHHLFLLYKIDNRFNTELHNTLSLR